jgi:alpha/beta superfamily hydrolase
MTDLPAAGGRAPGPGCESRTFFQSDDRLEGMLGWPDTSGDGLAPGCAGRAPRALAGGVVVAHPYPPHGATMAVPVVYRIARACRERRFATLRFNFRSVEGSLGAFSGTEEYRDVEAAVGFLAGRLAALSDGQSPGLGTPPSGSAPPSASAPPASELPLGLAGYSFGSIQAARAAADLPPVRALALVGFVVAWEHLLAGFRGPVLAVCAENDDVGPPEAVERELTRLGLDFTLEVVKDAGHFLEGRHREVGERVAAFFGEVLGPKSGAGQD